MKFWPFLIAGLLLLSFASALTPPTGGVTYYNFSSTTDLWSDHDGTNNGATSVANYPTFNITGDSSPNSFDFEESESDYVDTGWAGLDTGSLSISAWIRPESLSSTTYNTIAMTNDGTPSTAGLLRFSIGSGHTSFVSRAGVGIFEYPYAFNVSTWYHIVGTYDNSSLDWCIYINGAELNCALNDGATYGASSDNWYIGAENDDGTAVHFFDGMIDEVKFYNKSLTSTEVQNLYNYGSIEPVLFTSNITSVYFSPNTSVYTDTSFHGEAVLNQSLRTGEVVIYSYYRDTGSGFSLLDSGNVSSLSAGNTAVFPSISTGDTKPEYKFYVEAQVYNTSSSTYTSALRNSSILEVENRIPVLSNARISPNPIVNNSNFSGLVDASDADGHLLNISWNLYRNRTGSFSLLDSGTALNKAPGSGIIVFTKTPVVTEVGDQFYFSAQATDGYNTSNAAQSSIANVTSYDVWEFTFKNKLNGSAINGVTMTVTDGTTTITRTNNTGNVISFNELDDGLTGNLTTNISASQYKTEHNSMYNPGSYSVQLWPAGYWFNATNKYDNSQLTSFSVKIGANTYTTTGNALFVPLSGSNSYTWIKTNYFNQSGTVSYTVGSNTTIETVESYQSILRILARKKILNTTINSFTATDGTYSDTSSNGTAILYLDAGSHTITGAASGYTNVTKSISTSAYEDKTTYLYFGDATLNITAYNSYSDTSVANFTATLSHSNGYSESKNTTTGVVSFGVITGENWTVTLSSDGLATASTIIYQENNSQSYNFSLLPSNSINISIYDEETDNLVVDSNIILLLFGEGLSTYTFDMSRQDDIFLKDGAETGTGTWTYINKEFTSAANYKIVKNTKARVQTVNTNFNAEVQTTFSYTDGTDETVTRTVSDSGNYDWYTMNNPNPTKKVSSINIQGDGYARIINSSYSVDGNPYFFTDIGSGIYEFYFSAGNYYPRTYYINLNNTISQTLKAYLLNRSNTANLETQFTTINSQGDNVENVTLTFLKLFNGTYREIGEVKTDVAGEARIFLNGGTKYQILIQAPGYITRRVNLDCCNAIREYTITLAETPSYSFVNGGSGVYYHFEPSRITSLPQRFNLTISSLGELEYWGLNSSGELSNITGSPSGGTTYITIPANYNYSQTITVTIFWKKTGQEPVFIDKNFYYSNITAGNSSSQKLFEDFGNNIGPVFKAILATFISVGLVATFAALGAPSVVAGLAGLIVMGFFAFITWLNPLIYGFVAVAALLLWFFGGRR